MPEPSVAYVIYGDFSFTEYIVVFNGYYSTSARDGYVMAALDSSAVNSWKIIPRHNPASDYPSDFSLVKVNSVLKKNFKLKCVLKTRTCTCTDSFQILLALGKSCVISSLN